MHGLRRKLLWLLLNAKVETPQENQVELGAQVDLRYFYGRQWVLERMQQIIFLYRLFL